MSQRPPSRVCGAYARTAPGTCRPEGFTSARPATTTVGTDAVRQATIVIVDRNPQKTEWYRIGKYESISSSGHRGDYSALTLPGRRSS